MFARGSFNDVSVLAYSLVIFNGRSEHVDEAANSYWAILIQELSTIGTRQHFFFEGRKLTVYIANGYFLFFRPMVVFAPSYLLQPVESNAIVNN